MFKEYLKIAIVALVIVILWDKIIKPKFFPDNFESDYDEYDEMDGE